MPRLLVYKGVLIDCQLAQRPLRAFISRPPGLATIPFFTSGIELIVAAKPIRITSDPKLQTQDLTMRNHRRHGHFEKRVSHKAPKHHVHSFLLNTRKRFSNSPSSVYQRRPYAEVVLSPLLWDDQGVESVVPARRACVACLWISFNIGGGSLEVFIL